MPTYYKSCPFCREKIKLGATVCPHCTREVATAEGAQAELAMARIQTQMSSLRREKNKLNRPTPAIVAATLLGFLGLLLIPTAVYAPITSSDGLLLWGTAGALLLVSLILVISAAKPQRRQQLNRTLKSLEAELDKAKDIANKSQQAMTGEIRVAIRLETQPTIECPYCGISNPAGTAQCSRCGGDLT